MNLAGALLPFAPAGRAIVLVGAGGKTSLLFRLGEELAARGGAVLLTTTTHLADPRGGPRSGFRLLFRPDLEGPEAAAPLPEPCPGLTLLVARATDPPGKVKGIHPSWPRTLQERWDWVLVEADGSKRLPVKAPAAHEPVIPEGAGLVVGVIGLDCLGRPLDEQVAHRPERFAAVTGCRPGQTIAWSHLEALVAHPEGLFKGAPGPRAVLLNKADRAPFRPTGEQLRRLDAEAVLLGSLEGPDGGIVCQRGARC